MKNIKGRSPSHLRNFNQSVIIDLLKNKSYCCNDISKILGLCNSAIKYIVDELYQQKILTIDNSIKERSVGRAPIYYKLNKYFGIVIAVDLINSIFEISDISGEILFVEKFNIGFSSGGGHKYELTDIKNIIECIKSAFAKPEFKNYMLRAAVVATFGKLDVDSGKFVWVQSINSEINLKEIFIQNFSVPVEIYNDVHLAAIAESEWGKLKGRKNNSLYIKIGEGIASTLFIDNKIILGDSFRSGEIGYGIVYSSLFKEYKKISEIVTLFSIKKNIQKFINIKEKISLSDDMSFEQIIQAYKNKDDICRDVINDSAKCLGMVIRNYLSLLDSETIIIAGDITKFGGDYLDIVNNELNFNGKNIECVFSELQGDEIILGAKNLAINLAIKSNLRNIKNNE